jgi:hypothetical protein
MISALDLAKVLKLADDLGYEYNTYSTRAEQVLTIVFHIPDEDEDAFRNKKIIMVIDHEYRNYKSYNFDFWVLSEVEVLFNKKLKEKQLRKAALAKLTKEEIKLLGIEND